MYLPDLFLGDRFANVYGFKLNEEHSFFTYEALKSQDKRDLKEKKESNRISLDIFIHNIGFGAAKYIKCTWSYDYNKFVNLIKQIIDKKQYQFTSEINQDERSFRIKHIPTGHTCISSDYLELNTELDIVLPKNSIERSPLVSIPEIFIDFLSYYIAIKYEMFNSSSDKTFIYDELIEVPELSLSLSYLDIRNKKYNKGMTFKFAAFGYYNNEFKRIAFGNRNLWMYSIKINEIN